MRRVAMGYYLLREQRMRRAFYALPILALWIACGRETLVLLPEPHDSSAGGAPNDDDGAAFGASSSTSLTCTQSGDCNQYVPHCDVTTQTCVECLTALHCDAPETCELLTHRCGIPCMDDPDCTRDWQPRCNTSRGFCVECLDDSDCNSQYERFCVPDTGYCVECLIDAHCGSDAPHCDQSRHRCEAR